MRVSDDNHNTDLCDNNCHDNLFINIIIIRKMGVSIGVSHTHKQHLIKTTLICHIFYHLSSSSASKVTMKWTITTTTLWTECGHTLYIIIENIEQCWWFYNLKWSEFRNLVFFQQQQQKKREKCLIQQQQQSLLAFESL